MNLYPYLPLSTARSLAGELATLSHAALLERSSDWDERALFPPIGGEKVDRDEVRRLQGLVRSRMRDAEASSERQSEAYEKFDKTVAPLLLREMNIAPHEASRTGLWAFLACVVLPDVVRWRFPGSDTSGTAERRFVGETRGVRNAIGRLWWRAFVFGDPDSADPWELVTLVGEDQSVQILERPFLSGNPALARAILRASTRSGSSRQQDLVRETTKRMLRVAGAVPLEALPLELLTRSVSTALEDSLRALADPGTLVLAASEETVRAPRPVSPTQEGHADAAAPDPSGAVPERARLVQARISAAQLKPGPSQGIILVPDAVAPYLPALEESYVNPERTVIAVDDDGQRWAWVYVHHNRSGGGRSLAGLTPYLIKSGARVGDLLRIAIGSGGMLGIRLERAALPPQEA